jgi:hypothetical protein
MAMLCCFVLQPVMALAEDRRLPWHSFPGAVASALHAFRQTNHWIAEAMSENLDGTRQGRDTAAGRSYNFDPSRHLLYSAQDLSGDGRAEVFLLFDWPAVRGNREARGVLMISTGPAEWRIGCDFSDWGDESSRGGIRLLDSRSHGWRNFRTSDAIYAWRPVRGQPGAMECWPTRTIPLGRPGRASR